ncbi:MAG: prepilin-type N-terminal cleavage/methylation domain-containing protein [Kiritimatiellae bacterium]|nr:prepilin-type N-terminal cleavage/methylation domain-containing protein [Kiritimatiellia bacterium]
MKKAFTFVEAMVASAISAIVLTAVASSFLSTQRMLKTAMSDTELSLAARELREKLLFHAAPTIDGIHYAGLLSGTNANSVVDSATWNITMNASAVGETLGDFQPQSIALQMQTANVVGYGGANETRYYLFNDGMPDSEDHAGWLYPGSMSLSGTSMDAVVDARRMSSTQPLAAAYAIVFDLELRSNENNLDGTPITRRERVSVPLFGKLQPFMLSDGGY